MLDHSMTQHEQQFKKMWLHVSWKKYIFLNCCSCRVMEWRKTFERKALSTHFCMHELIDGDDWLVLLRVYAMVRLLGSWPRIAVASSDNRANTFLLHHLGVQNKETFLKYLEIVLVTFIFIFCSVLMFTVIKL